MKNGLALEICVESAERAVAAERGGADRIEVCGDLFAGGVTPSADAMRAARRQVRIPIHALIRPRPGNFFYSTKEFEAMKRDVSLAKDLGMDGLVLGVLTENDQVDRERTGLLVEMAHPLPVTFHRAFDLCQDLQASLQSVVETGATRLLTAGGNAGVTNSLSNLANLVAAAGDRIVIMPGGGVRAGNVQNILVRTGAREIHTSLTRPRKPASRTSEPQPATRNSRNRDAAEFEARVRKVRDLVDSLYTNRPRSRMKQPSL